MTMTSIGTIKLGADIFVNLKSGSIDKHYKTDILLGQGAYGKVWKVIHKTTGIFVIENINKLLFRFGTGNEITEEICVDKGGRIETIFGDEHTEESGSSQYCSTVRIVLGRTELLLDH